MYVTYKMRWRDNAVCSSQLSDNNVYFKIELQSSVTSGYKLEFSIQYRHTFSMSSWPIIKKLVLETFHWLILSPCGIWSNPTLPRMMLIFMHTIIMKSMNTRVLFSSLPEYFSLIKYKCIKFFMQFFVHISLELTTRFKRVLL